MADRPTRKVAGVSDAAVAKATGKGWAEWLALIDKAGGQQMTHQRIVAYLRDQHGLGGWWQQMVTVGYEQARKRRQKGEVADGFQVSASKTVAAPLSRLYAAWADEGVRATWLGKRRPLTVSKSTARKSMRFAWGRGKRQSRVSVNFYAKGRGKSQVVLEHGKIGDADEAEKLKTLWRGALDKLKGQLEEK